MLRCGRPGGGGGGVSVISDTPGRGGEGGSKKGKFLRTSFMDGPLLFYLCKTKKCNFNIFKLFQHYKYNKFVENKLECVCLKSSSVKVS